MENNPRVQIIPVKPKPRDKRVVIYAVSVLIVRTA